MIILLLLLLLLLLSVLPTVTQRFGKHTPTEANPRYSMASIAKQRISKIVSLMTEAILSTWSVQNGY
jgi:hypothetical protein